MCIFNTILIGLYLNKLKINTQLNMDKIKYNKELNIHSNNNQNKRNTKCQSIKDNKQIRDKTFKVTNLLYNQYNSFNKSNVTIVKKQDLRNTLQQSMENDNTKKNRNNSTIISSASYNIRKSKDNSLQINQEEKGKETGKFGMNYSHFNSMDQIPVINHNLNKTIKEKPGYSKQKVENRLIEQQKHMKQNKREIKQKSKQNILFSNDFKSNKTTCSIIKKIKNNSKSIHSNQRNQSKKLNKSNSLVKINELKHLNNEMSIIMESRKRLNDYYYQKTKSKKSFPLNKFKFINEEMKKMNESDYHTSSNLKTLDNKEQIDPQFSFRQKEITNPIGNTDQCIIKVNKVINTNNYPHRNNESNQSINRNDSTNSYQSQNYTFDYNMFKHLSQHHQHSPAFQCIHDNNIKRSNYINNSNKIQDRCFYQENKKTNINKNDSRLKSPYKEEKDKRLNDLEQIKLLAHDTIDQKGYINTFGNNTNMITFAHDQYIREYVTHDNQQHCCNHSNQYCFNNNHICCNSFFS